MVRFTLTPSLALTIRWPITSGLNTSRPFNSFSMSSSVTLFFRTATFERNDFEWSGCDCQAYTDYGDLSSAYHFFVRQITFVANDERRDIAIVDVHLVDPELTCKIPGDIHQIELVSPLSQHQWRVNISIIMSIRSSSNIQSKETHSKFVEGFSVANIVNR